MEETKQPVQPAPQVAPAPPVANAPVAPSNSPDHKTLYLIIILLAGAGIVAIMYSQKSYNVTYTPQPSAYASPTGRASPSVSPINSRSDLNPATLTLDAQDTTQISNTLNQNTQDTSKF